MTKIIDLRPDKVLINSNFEKYQFSSETILDADEKSLKAEILRLELSTTQDSFLEARLFAFHNHLFKNPYDDSCWFIDKNGGIWKFQSKGSLLQLIGTSETLTSPSCIYNPSIAFASENIIAVCHGSGTLEFFIQSDGSINNFIFDDVGPAVVLDAKYIKNASKIIAAIYKIELDEDKGKRFSRLVFLTYSYKLNAEDLSQTLELIQKQTLKVRGAIESVHIENNGEFCNVISQDQIEYEYDSLNPIERAGSTKDPQIRIPKYCWSQDEDSITVYVKVPEKYANTTTKINATPTSITIEVGDIILLNGQTPNRLEAELTTWKRDNDNLEVEISKSESGLMWSELLKGDTGGEYLPNEALAAEIHSRLSHLCSSEQESNVQGQPTIGFNSEQLEECDVSGSENFLQRINLNTHNITHMAMLGSSNRVLFCEKQSNGQIVCLRHDHDGCIWFIEDSKSKNWELKHIHTYPGFGYVEASKTNKKFCISPPDGSFIAIVEHTRHAFLYEKPEQNAPIGNQRILDFGSETSPVLGAQFINKYLFILTKNTLYQLRVY